MSSVMNVLIRTIRLVIKIGILPAAQVQLRRSTSALVLIH